MPTSKQKPEPESTPEAAPTDEEKRAARAAAWLARRAARGRGPDGVLRWTITGAGEGPSYDVSGVSRAKGPGDDFEIRHVHN